MTIVFEYISFKIISKKWNYQGIITPPQDFQYFASLCQIDIIKSWGWITDIVF